MQERNSHKSSLLAPVSTLVAAAVMLFSISASAEPWVEARGGLSYLSQLAVGVGSPGTVHYSGSVGYDFGNVRVGLLGEHSIWILENVTESDTFFDSVLNIGLVTSIEYFDDRAFTSIAAGPSILLFDTVTTDAGEVGIFGHLTPIGFRLPLIGALGLNVRPLNLTMSAPILTSIPLFRIAFNSDVGLEYTF